MCKVENASLNEVPDESPDLTISFNNGHYIFYSKNRTPINCTDLISATPNIKNVMNIKTVPDKNLYALKMHLVKKMVCG